MFVLSEIRRDFLGLQENNLGWDEVLLELQGPAVAYWPRWWEAAGFGPPAGVGFLPLLPRRTRRTTEGHGAVLTSL
jgi:hypothetical protein